MTVNSGNLYYETTKRSRDFRVYPWSLQLDKHAEAETHHEPHGITGSDFLPHRGYMPLVSQGERGERRGVSAEGVPPVERGPGVKGRATKCRRPWNYRRSYSGYHNRTPIRVPRRPSRVATQQVRRAKWDFLRVREPATIRRKCISEIAATAGVPRSFFLFFSSFEARIPNPVPPISSLPTLLLAC